MRERYVFSRGIDGSVCERDHSRAQRADLREFPVIIAIDGFG